MVLNTFCISDFNYYNVWRSFIKQFSNNACFISKILRCTYMYKNEHTYLNLIYSQNGLVWYHRLTCLQQTIIIHILEYG